MSFLDVGVLVVATQGLWFVADHLAGLLVVGVLLLPGAFVVNHSR